MRECGVSMRECKVVAGDAGSATIHPNRARTSDRAVEESEGKTCSGSVPAHVKRIIVIMCTTGVSRNRLVYAAIQPRIWLIVCRNVA
jgi:hypothetical protein